MKNVCLAGVLFLGAVYTAQAQEATIAGIQMRGNAAADYGQTSASRTTLLQPSSAFRSSFAADDLASPTTETAVFATALAVPVNSSEEAASASLAAQPAPTPEPKPKFLYGGRDDYRWQLGIGAAWERFRSSVYNASAVGVNTSVAYYTNDWFAIEGSITSTFAPTILLNEHVKLINYVAGPKIAWRQRKWEPWAHLMAGGTHAQPQAIGSRNGFAVQAGGGADYRWNPRISLRLEGDWLRTSLFKQTQNNFLLIGGIVFHF